MKKLLCLLLCLCLICGLSACVTEDTPTKETGSNQNEPTKKQEESTKATEKKDETFTLNDTAAFTNLKITATELKESVGVDFFTPEAGKVFVGVNFTIENISDEPQNISSLMLFTAYADDVKCDYSFNAACAFDDGTLDGEIAAGKKLIGWYAVEIPSDWKTLQIDFIPELLSNSPAQFVFAK